MWRLKPFLFAYLIIAFKKILSDTFHWVNQIRAILNFGVSLNIYFIHCWIFDYICFYIFFILNTNYYLHLKVFCIWNSFWKYVFNVCLIYVITSQWRSRKTYYLPIFMYVCLVSIHYLIMQLLKFPLYIFSKHLDKSCYMFSFFVRVQQFSCEKVLFHYIVWPFSSNSIYSRNIDAHYYTHTCYIYIYIIFPKRAFLQVKIYKRRKRQCTPPATIIIFE